MTEEHQPGVDNPEFYDTVDSEPCVVCGKRNPLDTSGRRTYGRTWVYFCQGQHTPQEITNSIAQKERDA